CRVAGVKPRDGETALQALRHHLMQGLLARVAATTRDFVLRGGYLTRVWIEPLPRPAEDLDFVGDFAFDIDDTVARFRPALACTRDDGIVIDVERLVARGIWLHTAFPGVHLDVAIGVEHADQRLGIDIGFGDPLVPPAVTWDDGLRVVRPETQLAWKLHGLVEHAAQWRPKDLADLWLIATRVHVDDDALVLAIDVAFTSRGYTVAQAVHALDDAAWSTKSARVRWASQRGLVLADVIADVRARLAPVFAKLEVR
ncbi:MAG TPA: nucleotidyl transferase AbiEii/AbiGii toxin family protein, partial [Kofleriaceae bacterium]|nr:nucleotidyl transferase AbiEii/AbiGii toxin family protein [Kofleriaceae bacterium]